MRTLATANLVLALLGGAAVLAAQDDAHRHPARLLGVYDLKTGDPLEGAQVLDLIANVHVQTPANGTVTLGFLATQHDSAVVMVRKLGHRDSSFVVRLGPADTSGIMVFLDRVIALDAIVTTAKYRLDEDAGKWAGFEQRCSVNHVSCLRAQELADHPASSISDRLIHAPDVGVKRTCMGSISNCSVTISGCRPNYFLDGFIFLPGPGGGSGTLAQLERFLGPKEVKGIEVYRPELTPLKFSRGAGSCAVVVWTN